MNTPEKYVTAYIVESLTGIEGSTPERVHEVLRNSDFTIDDPFLKLIYDIARYNPESQKVKDVVAGLVVGHTLLTNKSIQEAVEKTLDSQVAQRLEENKPKVKEVTLAYSIEGDTMCCTVWFDEVLVSTLMAPAAFEEKVVEKFYEKFPEGNVIS